MKRVLVTGAGGFVGRYCCPELAARGFEVHGAFSPRTASLPAPTAKMISHRLDLFDLAAVGRLLQQIRPTHLLHLAWITTPGEYWTSLRNLDWAVASLQLLRLFGERGGERVVVAGSCAEYDWSSGFCSETSTPLRPKSLYGVTKRTLEQHMNSYAAQIGFNAAWARLFFLYGPHASAQRLPGAIIAPLLRGEIAHCSTGELERDYLYITDAAAAICRLLDSNLSGAVNISTGTPLLLKDMIRTCAKLIDREDLLAWGTVPIGNEAPTVVGDSRRLREELGWAPRISLTNGLMKTINWWRTLPGDFRAAA